MIPSVISSQVQRGIEDFLRTTFPPSNPFFHGILDRLFADHEQLFKGPYVSVKLPYRPGSIGRDFFEPFGMGFDPFLHQERAFERIAGEEARSTIVSTGTGSGKTECFLYPILDYCWRHRGEPGIKAIIVYPMNALANDQAKRMARFINSHDKLDGNLTAGLFVGDNPGGKGQMRMTPDMVITHKDGMRASPPDILLTNYKMLDYLLIRPVDLPLWKDNGPETLKYLVVDELHTFDGAQGTDLACLLRRLKERVHAPRAHLCCVGTSATLGGGDDTEELRRYAADIFGESFDEDSVITEDLLSPAEFFGNSFITQSGTPYPEHLKEMNPEDSAGFEDFVATQYRLWFGEEVDQGSEDWKTALPDRLMQHAFFRNLILVLNNGTLAADEITARIRRIEPTLKAAPPEHVAAVVNSILALVSSARLQRGKEPAPFLNVRIQLWMRELRRIVAGVHPEPRIRFSDDLPAEELKRHLPLVHCRECGAMGWAGAMRQHDNRLESDLKRFYQLFFNHSPAIHFIFPETEVRTGTQQTFGSYLCGACLHLGAGQPPERCPECGDSGALMPVGIHNERIKSAKNDHVYGTHNCPYCLSHESLTIMGSRAASLLAVVIGQLFNSTYYEANDKKLLAFSDSVQDASHRAGFFEARTFRFNFRTATQKALQTLEDTVSLEDLPDVFMQYWRARLSVPDYVATFLAPNMAWYEDYGKLVAEGTLPENSILVKDVDKRIEWELLSEFGFAARIGRTLEKTGCAVAYPDPPRLTAVADTLSARLLDEIGGWSDLPKDRVLCFLAGIVSQLRVRGGVHHDCLDGYIHSWGGYYKLGRLPFMPNFGKHSRTPALLTTKRGTRFDALIGSGTTESWYEDWLRRVLGPHNPRISDYADQVYSLALELMAAQELMVHIKGLSHPVWALTRGGLMIGRKVDQYCCDTCGFFASAAEQERDTWRGMPCRRFRCTGHYVRQPISDDYYGKLYGRGQVQRIFAAEHTGLLNRETREALEERFINQTMPASENLLSCTPTLEMGINIGDLSTVLLCSVPPSQSNYLQRVGRAGRQDGNAFNFTMAQGKPHDLYFFTAPAEMLAGAVATPGVFLNAPAVLERQFVGFCFDRWVETGVAPEQLPRKLGQALSDLNKNGDKAVFPFNWLAFIDMSRSALMERFVAIFGDALSKESQERLAVFVRGDGSQENSLVYKVTSRLHELAKEREDLRKRVQRVNKVIKTKEASPAKDQNTEDELASLRMEKSALNKIINHIGDRDTFNFFTDEGLLPNYAFPEAGVLLRSIIFSKKAVPDKQGKYNTRVFEYERSASTALHELAPANTFYAEKRKVKIDRINLDLSETEVWRFCNQCQHAVQEVLNTQKAACPKCGSPMWADDSQKRRMVRLKQVEATTSDRASRVDDSSDAREPEFYNKQMQVETDRRFVQKAFRIEGDDLPFGFEFLGKADFREINFGSQTAIGETIEIAGQEVPSQGFLVCKGCGKVKMEGADFRHAFTCRYHGKEADSQFLDFLYLYRQFSSEAVRILLPVTSFGVSAKRHSFIAALYLGLKETFRGSIDHLETAIVEEPVKDSEIKKQFLVLYDRVPGGTGYLKDLTKSGDAMLNLLEAALSALRACRCREDTEKDGCYHCLYAFRLSHDLNDISRSEAMSMLSAILERRDQVKEIESVSDISVNVLFDSELEARFIEAIRRAAPGGEPAQLTKEVVNGKPGWYLQMTAGSYRIEPQVELGESQGVSIPCKPDFIFYPERSGHGLPVAVFTDGFQYHADVKAGNLRVGADTAQRMAIMRSGRYRVWSLTWQDVESRFGKNGNGYFVNAFTPRKSGIQKLLAAYDEQYATKSLSQIAELNAFECLIAYLANPSRALWGVYSFILGISYQKNQLCFCDLSLAEQAGQTLLAEKPWADIQFPELATTADGTEFAACWHQDDKIGRPLLATTACGTKQDLRPETTDACNVVLRLFDDHDLAESDGFRSVWNGFLHALNLLQFLPKFRAVTTQGLIEQVYAAIPETAPAASVSGSDRLLHRQFEAIQELCAPSVAPILQTLCAAAKCPPEPGYELAGEHGQVAGTAELAWPDAKIAVLLPEQENDRHVFGIHGWTVIAEQEGLHDPTILTSKVPDYESRGEQ